LRATIQARNALGGYSAKTDNNILMVFKVVGIETLAVGEVIEVDLPNVLGSQHIVRVKTGRTIGIELGRTDIHDLDLPTDHGTSRMPSPDRMRGD
jgi:hypothetical protein